MGVFIALIIGLFAFEFAGYLIHRAMHFEWMGPLYRAHTAHHKLYPPEDYLSDAYRSPGKDSTLYRFAVIIGLCAGVALWLLPLAYTLPLMVEVGVIGLVNNYVHDASHIRGHWMERFGWFWILRDNHFKHHLNVQKNFGIVSFWSDKLFGSFLT